MILKSLINPIKKQILSIDSRANSKSNYNSIEIGGLSLNSKSVRKGDLFFCLSGVRYEGSDFIREASAKGAKVVIVEGEINIKPPKKLVVIRVKDVIKSLGAIADKFYDHSFGKIKSIAVTGTNGKTSTTFIIENILKKYHKLCGVVGTINYRFANNKFTAKNTTPDIITNYEFVNKMLKKNIRYLLMEVSSHALAQRRIEGASFDQAIFTNLSQDHFDYHKTKRNYFLAKSRLFTDYLKKGALAIINTDDSYGLKLASLIKKNKVKILTYGIKGKPDIKAHNIVLDSTGSCFSVRYKVGNLKIYTNLIGVYNIYNVLAGIASALALGIPKAYIVKGVNDVFVPGRLEAIRNNYGINIFIDYAHTEDALKNVLTTLKDLKGPSRLIVVFGCGGNRDKDKRHKMGRVASELADLVIVTSDNPRFEDAKDIISDINKGIRNNNSITLADRKQAIERAIDIAESGDIIIVAGKGHEDYQIIKDKKIPFSDRKVVGEALSQKEKASV